jgi:hypothetical protein
MFSKVITIVPLFFLVMILYTFMAAIGIDFGMGRAPIFEMALPSGSVWEPSWGGMFIMLGVVTLYVEILKSTRTGTGTIIEHALSMMVFILFFLEFLLWDKAGNSTFLIITLMSLLDVVAGFSITVASARRDFTMG